MSAAPEVINPQKVTEITQCWNGVHLVRKDSATGILPAKLLSGDASSSSDELNTKVRKPYTITKQRERWTETEHQKFLEALKLYGRAWRRIEEYIGTKTAVQIRSHAQKFFSKLERGASTGSSGGKLPDIAIPPPRPKRKPNHPYPKKAGTSPPVVEDESKETSLLSSAGIGAALSAGFQPASVYPYMSRGLGGVVESGAGGRFFRPQGSVKIFGKTVSVPKTNKASLPDDASYNRVVSEDSAVPAEQSSVAEPKQGAGFSPFVKARNPCVDSFPEAPKHLDRDRSYSGTTQSEGTGESLGRTCGYVAQENTEAANSVNSSDRECTVKDDADLGKVESSLLAAGLKEGQKVCVQVSQLTNPAIHSWMNNLFHYHSGVSIPPIPGSVVVDGPSNNSLNYWQFMQASAVSYAAYTAAMAAVAAAGWKASNPGGTDQAESAKSNNNESNESQLPSAPPPWWPYSSFIPPVGFPLPADALQRGVVRDTSKIANALGSEEKDGYFEESLPQPDTGLKAAEVGEICELALNVDCVTNDGIEDCTKTNSSAQIGSRFETSCRTEVSGFAKGFPDAHSQRDAEAVFLPVKLYTQNSNTETRASPNSLQNAYSSSDEFEEQGKKQGERSSSGSNTPASRYESCEWDAPIIAVSKKRDCCTLSENNDDSWNEAFQTSHQQCVTNTPDFSKLRLKHAEKGRKHQQRDSRHDDDSKRFKSCAHEMELRKEVSQEGRKAFQALFTSKLLPQTFPSAGGRDFSEKDEHVSRPTVSNEDESRSNECIKFRRVPHENANSEGNNAAHLEMGSESQGLDGLSAEVSSKGFTVSSSSGFVPYRRLV